MNIIYSTKEDYKNEICIINNEIIKTQWLNNKIRISDKKFRYIISFATHSNGDMIIEIVSDSKVKRMFYNIKSDGNPFFN